MRSDSGERGRETDLEKRVDASFIPISLSIREIHPSLSSPLNAESQKRSGEIAEGRLYFRVIPPPAKENVTSLLISESEGAVNEEREGERKRDLTFPEHNQVSISCDWKTRPGSMATADD
jgi:hypothetical protein